MIALILSDFKLIFGTSYLYSELYSLSSSLAFLSKICYNQNINHPIHQTILSYFGIIHQRRIKRMDNSNFFNEGYVLLDGIRSPLNCVHINVKNQSHLAVAHYQEYIELLYCIYCNMNLLSETKSYNIIKQPEEVKPWTKRSNIHTDKPILSGIRENRICRRHRKKTATT